MKYYLYQVFNEPFVIAGDLTRWRYINRSQPWHTIDPIHTKAWWDMIYKFHKELTEEELFMEML